MKTLTANTTTEKNKVSTTPINILKIELPTAGTKYYSDQPLGTADASSWDNAESRVSGWGSLNEQVNNKGQSVVGGIAITLLDTDKTLKGYLDAEDFERVAVTVYQYFSGLVQADLVTIFKGIITSPINYQTSPPQLILTITDISTYNDLTVGNVATRDDFSSILSDDENKVLPIVFGDVKRSRAVFVSAGRETKLAKYCTATDHVLYVEDSSAFAQNSDYDLKIDDEVVTGQFDGAQLTVAQRANSVLTSQTTGEDTTLSFIDNTLSASDDYYNGYFVKITDPDGDVHERKIVSYDDTLKRIVYNVPIFYGTWYWAPTVGTNYSIGTRASSHKEGTPVVEVLSSYVYIVNDAPSKDVTKVEARGDIYYDVEYQGRNITVEKQGWVQIPTSAYSVNKNDTTTFPALGRAVTTLTFSNMRPSAWDDRLTDDTLYVDIKGIEDNDDSTGALIENPATVIEKVMTKYMSLTAGTDTDATSFSNAETELTSYKFAFTLAEKIKAIDLCSELAFQCRCELVWEEGVAKLNFMTLATGTSSATIAKSKMLLDTIKITRSDYDDLITGVDAYYRDRDETKQVAVSDATAEAAYGRRVHTMDLWAYQNSGLAKAIANFYLYKWKLIYFQAYFETPLTSLELERSDWITIDNTDFFSANQKAKIIDLVHIPGGAETLDTIGITCELPITSGCSSTCEMPCEAGSCESTGCELLCETGCDYSCESYACEEACQTIAEFGCTTSCDYSCMSAAEICIGCETSCQEGCTTCETSAEYPSTGGGTSALSTAVTSWGTSLPTTGSYWTTAAGTTGSYWTTAAGTTGSYWTTAQGTTGSHWTTGGGTTGSYWTTAMGTTGSHWTTGGGTTGSYWTTAMGTTGSHWTTGMGTTGSHWTTGMGTTGSHWTTGMGTTGSHWTTGMGTTGSYWTTNTASSGSTSLGTPPPSSSGATTTGGASTSGATTTGGGIEACCPVASICRSSGQGTAYLGCAGFPPATDPNCNLATGQCVYNERIGSPECYDPYECAPPLICAWYDFSISECFV